MTPIVLTVPMPPNMANARMHWRTRLRAKKAYLDEVTAGWAVSVMTYERTKYTPRRPERASVRVHAVVGARHDVDNLFARMKFALDWLVSVGYLTDDSPKHLEWEGIPTQEVSRKKPPTLTFTITPLSPNPGATDEL